MTFIIFKSDFNSYSYVTDNTKKLGMAPEDLGLLTEITCNWAV